MQLPFITNSQLGFANLTNQLSLPNANTRTAAASFVDLPGLFYMSSGDVSMRPLISNDPYEISSPMIPGLSLSSFTANGLPKGPPLFSQTGPSTLVDNQGFPITQSLLVPQQPAVSTQAMPFGSSLLSPNTMTGVGSPTGGMAPVTNGGLGQLSTSGADQTALIGAIVQNMLPTILQQVMSSQSQFSQQPQFSMAPVGGAIYSQANSPQNMFGYQQATMPYLTGMPSVQF